MRSTAAATFFIVFTFYFPVLISAKTRVDHVRLETYSKLEDDDADDTKFPKEEQKQQIHSRTRLRQIKQLENGLESETFKLGSVAERQPDFLTENKNEDFKVLKGQTSQPKLDYATESPKQESASHTSGPNVVKSSTMQYFDELTSSYITLNGPNDSIEEPEPNEENSTTMSKDKVKQICMTMPVKSQLWSTICEGILSVVVGICGLMGNGATIAVLSRPTFRETFHKLLICLSCFDSLFIGCALMIYAIRAHSLHLSGESLIHYMFMILYPLGNVALYGSIYITLAVSIERFLGLVFPVQSRTRPRRHLLAYLLPVIIFSVGFNIPKALEFQVHEVNNDNGSHVEGGESDWARDATYTHFYKVWSNLILTAVLPLIVLIFCNSAIFIVLRQSRKAMVQSRQKSNNISGVSGGSGNSRSGTNQSVAVPTQTNGSMCCNPNSNSSSNSCQSSEHSLAIILAAIVFVFMICHACRFFLAFYQVSIAQRTSQCIERGLALPQPEWLYMISAINHLMLMVNSSVNFIIYCAVGSRFRRALTCPLLGSAGNRRARYLAATQWAAPQNSNQAHNINSYNHESNLTNKKFVRVIWRRRREVCRDHSADVAGSQVDSVIERVQVKDKSITARRPIRRYNTWQENEDDITIGLITKDVNTLPASNLEPKTKTMNGLLCQSHSDLSWSDGSQGSTPANWFKVKAEVNLDTGNCLLSPSFKKAAKAPIKTSVQTVTTFSKSSDSIALKHCSKIEIESADEKTCTSTDI